MDSLSFFTGAWKVYDNTEETRLRLERLKRCRRPVQASFLSRGIFSADSLIVWQYQEMSGCIRGVLEFLVEVLKVMCSFPGGTWTQKEEMYE